MSEHENTFKKTPAAQRRFHRVLDGLRTISRGKLDRETQEEAAYLINDVQNYGMSFFPNHYVMDQILRLESIVEENK